VLRKLTPDEEMWLVFFLASVLLVLVIWLIGNLTERAVTHGVHALRGCEVFRTVDRAAFLNCANRSLNSFLPYKAWSCS